MASIARVVATHKGHSCVEVLRGQNALYLRTTSLEVTALGIPRREGEYEWTRGAATPLGLASIGTGV